MNAQIRILKADIASDLESIAEIFASLSRYIEPSSEEQLITVAYYLHNLYCAFESIFQRIAETFGNHIPDRSGWHADLLRRMTLNIEGIRPPVISDEAFESLDELRRFRHLFRSAYRTRLDAERLVLVLKKARALEQIYLTDLKRFLTFLDSLTQVP